MNDYVNEVNELNIKNNDGSLNIIQRRTRDSPPQAAALSLDKSAFSAHDIPIHNEKGISWIFLNSFYVVVFILKSLYIHTRF